MTRMTRTEFFRLLPKTGWMLEDNQWMRRKIKGRQPSYCPVTAVAHRKLGTYFPVYQYNLAAKKMRLPQKFANEIVVAADSKFAGSHGLRTLLLKHTGLAD